MLCRYDQNYVPYGMVLCIFQLYRVFLLPFANTWMLYSLLEKLEVSISLSTCGIEGALVACCCAIPARMRTLLHVPIQLISVSFTASVASKLCPASGSLTVLSICMGSVLSLQLALTMVLPVLLAVSFEAGSCRSFVPHVQAKRSLFQA